MTIWEELGIEATVDTKLIRKAYSQKLKLVDRKNDIDGFQRLHTAYEQAMALAKIDSSQTVKLSDLLNLAMEQNASLRPSLRPLPESEPQSSSVSIQNSWRELNVALAQFFDNPKNFQSVDDFLAAYNKLRQLPGFQQDLISFGFMGPFLARLLLAMRKYPGLVSVATLNPIFKDFDFNGDIKLFNQYAAYLNEIVRLVRLEEQKRAWLMHVSPTVAEILMDKSNLRRGFGERWKRWRLAYIMGAIRLLEKTFPLLIGQCVSPEKIAYWKNINRSFPLTMEHIIAAFPCMFIFLGLVSIAAQADVFDLLGYASLPIGFLSTLFYFMLDHHLSLRLRESAEKNGIFHRIFTFIRAKNFVYSILVGSLLIGLGSIQRPSMENHLLAIVSILLFILILEEPWTFLLFGFFTGGWLAVFMNKSNIFPDFAIALQFGLPLYYYLRISFRRLKNSLARLDTSPGKAESSIGQSKMAHRLTLIALAILALLHFLMECRRQ